MISWSSLSQSLKEGAEQAGREADQKKNGVKKDPNQGIRVDKWFWASAFGAPSKTIKQADAASSQGPSLRAGVKESAVPEKRSMMEMNFRATKFLEAVKNDSDAGLIFKTVVLQEGLGNLRDAYWYSKQALESAVPVFEGKKIYANHPSALDEENRPERDVRDILGHFENVQVETDEDGRSMLTANVVILPQEQYDWARGLMTHSLDYAKKYPDKEFVGLSINASGASDEMSLEDFLKTDPPSSTIPKLMKAQAEGIDSVNVVKAIENAVSIDLVTEPGAGGKILKLIEEERMATKGKTKEAAEKKTIKTTLKEDEGGSDGKDGGKDGGGDDGDGGHDDEDQDKKLIKSMIKKHLGDKSDGSEEEEAMYKQAVAAYGEMGYEGEKAHEAAGHAMKLSKHMQSKKEAADKEEGECVPDKKESTEAAEASEAKENSMESEIIELKATVAKLTEAANEVSLEKHVEKICKDSGLPRKATDLFRVHLKEHGVKNVEKADRLWKTFNETYKAAGSESSGYVISTEKQVTDQGGKSVSFADCKID